MRLNYRGDAWKKQANKIYYRGQVFESQKKASYHLGLTETTIKTYLKKGEFKGYPIIASKTFSSEELERLFEKDAMIKIQG